ncbi:MAG TPA: type II and III secretion system protein, partial [Thermoanaerobaculia bacterium]|nr:type II and III secretion system protein [Thermoanaerobaculia bacterium]
MILIVLLSGAAAAQEPAAPRFRIELRDESLVSALEEALRREGVALEIIGDASAPVTLSIERDTLDALARDLALKAGFLAVRRGDGYLLFGTGAESHPLGRDVVYTHRLRSIPSDVAVEELGRLGIADVRVSAVRSMNAVLVRGTLDAVRTALRTLDAIDDEGPTVYVEMLVVEFFHGDSFQWEFDIVDATYRRVTGGGFDPADGGISGVYNFVRKMPEQFRLNLRALVADNSVKIITNPHVAVRNGEQAEIKFDQEQHIILTPPPSAQLVMTSTLEKINAAIELSVTPLATGNGFVHLDVLGSVGFFVPAPAGQFAIDRQTVKSRVTLVDGETLILGGLIKERVTESDQGFPYLRRVPLLGLLFKKELAFRDYTETVIYITPRVGAG